MASETIARSVKIAADSVTLDLDGHTVVFGRTARDNVHGIHASHRSGLKLLGGVIEEGPGPERRRFPVFIPARRFWRPEANLFTLEMPHKAVYHHTDPLVVARWKPVI